MAKSVINVGTAANDGTGDNLRAGAAKINANSEELYSACLLYTSPSPRDRG